MQIKRPDVVKVFGKDAMQGNYLPVKFGTNVVVPKESFENIANKNFEYGLESLEGDLQMKDLNTVFFYDSVLLKYLFTHGIPEFSTYEDYPIGAVVQYNGEVWISTKEVKASTHKKAVDPCDPCGCKTDVCENPIYPSKDNSWCKVITSCEYDSKIAELEEKDAALEKSINNINEINNIKGVKGFAILPNKTTGALELDLELSDNSHITIPMTKFGHIERKNDGTLSITNANGTTLEVPPIKVKAAKEADGKVVITNQDGSTVEIGKPVEFDLSQHVDNKTVRLKDGKLEVIKEKCATVTNLNTLEVSDGNLKQLGISCFTGVFNAADANTAIGAPVEFGKTNVEKSDAITAKEDITSGNQLDFTGWQVATGKEVHQYIYSRVGDGVQSGWVRSNDSGMNEDGTLKNPNDWGKWVYELNLPKQPTASSGLDCAAIDALPERQWKKGTTILAKQDGECVRLVAFDSIFQEIGVGITADKTNAFVNEEYRIVVTVSNTGEGKNELTNLNIVGPANTSDYEIKDVTFTKSEADVVEQVNNLTYNIRGLKKSGTVVVKYTVVPKVLGNYQFTAAVNPNSALDKDLGNNNATLILNAHTKADPNYVPSVDCPLIVATELGSNTQLTQLRTKIEDGKQYASTNVDNFGNLFANRETLKGLKIRLENASTVVGYKHFHGWRDGYILSNGNIAASNLVNGDSGLTFDNVLNSRADGIKSGTDGFTFENGVVTITEDVEVFAISCRPQGNNCKWQHYMFSTALAPTTKAITTSNVIGGGVSIIDTYVNEVTLDGDVSKINVVPNNITVNKNKKVQATVARNSRATRVQKLVFRVRAGTAASLNYTSTNNYAVTHSAGKTTITENSITVAADAKPTDSVNTNYIQVIVE